MNVMAANQTLLVVKALVSSPHIKENNARESCEQQTARADTNQ